MVNITQDISVPEGLRINAPIYDHIKHGWGVRHSSITRECMPIYTNDGPSYGKLYSNVSDALRQSLKLLDSNIAENLSYKEKVKSILGDING